MLDKDTFIQDGGSTMAEAVNSMPVQQPAMAQSALPVPGENLPSLVGTPPGVTSIGGIMEIKSAAQLIEEERAKAQEENSEPMIQGLAGHIRRCWYDAKSNKENGVERRMLKSLRQRRGEYEPDLKRVLEQQNSATIYMMLTSNKCRSAAAWLREAMGGLPWTCEPTPVSDITDLEKFQIMQKVAQQVQQAIAMTGQQPEQSVVTKLTAAYKDQAVAEHQEEMRKKAERMTKKMKDQMIEGGFEKAFDEFLDDLVTFPSACLKGPVIRSRPELKWIEGEQEPGMQSPKMEVQVVDTYKLEWERVDPFNLYPAPDASGVDDGYLIERHLLSRADLAALRGVEGYSEASINAALADFQDKGYKEQLSVDTERETVEGKNYAHSDNPSGLIEALQFWGSVPGTLLIDWGMEESEIPDPLDEYHIEAWLVKDWVIKATINPDPLHRKPYYKASWENIPGSFWGNSVPDLCRDTQDMCNAAARALANNMGISSGPQVMVNASRLPAGEDITEMYPWKVWQYTDDGFGTPGAAQPIGFFQPASNAAELMQIYQHFSILADEYTGIPKYMTGDAATGGAGRTASGLSMLMSNAGKTIKGVITGIDHNVVEPSIKRLYVYNMQYLDDPDLKGDVNIVANGAMALIQKEAQQAEFNQFFQLTIQSPVVQQIVGPKGIAYMLREVVKRLAVNPDKLVPSDEILEQQMLAQQAMMAQAQEQQAAKEQQDQGQPNAGGSPAKTENQTDGNKLMDGTPRRV